MRSRIGFNVIWGEGSRCLGELKRISSELIMTGARDESMKTCNAVPSSLVIQKVSELKLGKQNKLSLTQIRSPHCGPQGLT